MNLITDTDKLVQACKRLVAAEFITVDTEFMRESTFWPQLCLIQIASADDEIIIDALAPEINLTPFFDLMGNEAVIKVFHAARQDIEIIHHLAGVVPHPVFDTQLASMVCGFGESVSYAMLVKKLLNVDLDKTSRFTDWSRRPLADKQLTYALADVTYLRELFPKISTQIERAQRAGWLDEEMAVLTDPATYESHPERAWRRLKMRVKSAKSMAVLMEIAAWREAEAQAQDMPRNWILKDEAIYDLANQAPRNQEELSSLRTIHEGFSRSARGRGVLEAVARGLKRDPAGVPRIKRNAPLSPENIAVIDLLRVLLKTVAARNGVAPKLIATAGDLETIARNDHAEVAALKGWRRQLFGDGALALKRGELALAMGGKGVTVIRLGDIGAGDQKGSGAERHEAGNGGDHPAVREAGGNIEDDMARGGDVELEPPQR